MIALLRADKVPAHAERRPFRPAHHAHFVAGRPDCLANRYLPASTVQAALPTDFSCYQPPFPWATGFQVGRAGGGGRRRRFQVGRHNGEGPGTGRVRGDPPCDPADLTSRPPLETLRDGLDAVDVVRDDPGSAGLSNNWERELLSQRCHSLISGASGTVPAPAPRA